jgi:CRP-like cAMP-binding protein
MTRPRSTLLQRTPAFDRVDEAVLKRILVRAVPVQLARKQILWDQGEPCAAVGWVRGGVIREVIAQGDREIVLDLHGRGDPIGEGPALEALVGEGIVHGSRFEAHEESVVLCLPIRELAELAGADPGLARGLGALGAIRRRRVEQRLVGLVFRSARARMAEGLLELAERFGVRDSRGVIVNLRLTHRDLAALAGTSRETASTALLDWRRDGIVLVEGKRVVLLDPDKLAALARDDGGP